MRKPREKIYIRTPFPKIEKVAKILGISKLRWQYLKGLVDGIQTAKTRKKRTK